MSLPMGPSQAEQVGCSSPSTANSLPSPPWRTERAVLVCPPTCPWLAEILDSQVAGGIFVDLAPRLALRPHTGAVGLTTLPSFPGKQFKCTVCEYTAAQKPQLLRHMEQHASFKVRGCAGRGARPFRGQVGGACSCMAPLANGMSELRLGLLGEG